jgi:hypothetical protein
LSPGSSGTWPWPPSCTACGCCPCSPSAADPSRAHNGRNRIESISRLGDALASPGRDWPPPC